MRDRLRVWAPARNLNNGCIKQSEKSTDLFWYMVSRKCSDSSLVNEEVLSDSSINSKIRSTNTKRTTDMYEEWFKKSSHAPRASSKRGR